MAVFLDVCSNTDVYLVISITRTSSSSTPRYISYDRHRVFLRVVTNHPSNLGRNNKTTYVHTRFHKLITLVDDIARPIELLGTGYLGPFDSNAIITYATSTSVFSYIDIITRRTTRGVAFASIIPAGITITRKINLRGPTTRYAYTIESSSQHVRTPIKPVRSGPFNYT